MFNGDKDSDNYETDKEAWTMIKDYIPTDKKIWSPFYCTGKMKEDFKELFNLDIIHEDKDFFSYEPDDYGYIIDNPPYSKFQEIAIRLKELDKPFILIGFPKTFLTKKFQNLFRNNMQLIIPNSRPTFTHLNNPKKGYTPPFGTWYYCYKMNLEHDLTWL